MVTLWREEEDRVPTTLPGDKSVAQDVVVDEEVEDVPTKL